MDIRISLDVPAGPHAAAVVRRSLEGLRGYVEPQIFDDIRLLVTELVTNSCRHAGLEPGSSVSVALAVGRDEIRVQVSDEGSGFRVADRPQDRLNESGWGLRLVDRIADRWGVGGDKGATVWFMIDAGRRRGRARPDDTVRLDEGRSDEAMEHR